MSKSLFGFGITALILSVASVSGQQLDTVDQARAMLDRAITALKSNEATALSEFNDPNNKQFRERDLYVFCYDVSDGKITAYESPALLNIDVRTLALKDDPIGKRAYEAVQAAPEGNSRDAHWQSSLRSHILQIKVPVARFHWRDLSLVRRQTVVDYFHQRMVS
jgi:hypothetical protein